MRTNKVTDHLFPLCCCLFRFVAATGSGVTLPLHANPYDASYCVPLEIGNETVSLNIDTITSFSWLRTANTACASGQDALPCNPSDGSTYGGPSTDLDLTGYYLYADGTFVHGELHAVSVNVDCDPPVSVPMIMLFSDLDSVPNLNSAAGILGLGFSQPNFSVNPTGLCNPSSGPCPDSVWPRDQPFTNALFTLSGMSPVFGLALSRKPCNDSRDGILSFGITDSFSDPLFNLTDSTTEGAETYVNTTMIATTFNQPTPGNEFCSITGQLAVDSSITMPQTFIIDIADPFNHLNDSAFVAQIAESFDPPGWYDSTTGLWTVECNSTAPLTSTVVQDVYFPINPVDMIYPINNVCASVFQTWAPNQSGMRSLSQYNTLGQAFLKNVYLQIWQGNGTDNVGNTVELWSRQFYDC